jgi:SAM-dependent methyltransferase
MTVLPSEHRPVSRGPSGGGAGEVLPALHQAVATAQVVRTAERLGVLSLLSESGPASAVEVARSCGLATTATGRLLAALVDLGVLARVPTGRFALEVDVRPSWRWLETGWAGLEECVRDGRPVVAADSPGGAAELYPGLVKQLSLMFARPAASAARLLAPLAPSRVLDVGAGAAPWSLALAQVAPTARITCLDVPQVLCQTRAQVEAAGVSDRFDYWPGDVFQAELPAVAFDLVLLANLCHLFDAGRNAVLLRRLRSTLAPGGTLAIIDVLPPEDPQAQPRVSLYELGLLLRSERGQVYGVEQYAAWADAAHFGPLHAERLDGPFDLGLLTTSALGTVPLLPRLGGEPR